jgi:hypothetical protein
MGKNVSKRLVEQRWMNFEQLLPNYCAQNSWRYTFNLPKLDFRGVELDELGLSSLDADVRGSLKCSGETNFLNERSLRLRHSSLAGSESDREYLGRSFNFTLVAFWSRCANSSMRSFTFS